jgi:thioredoxin reductase (NADPH)
MATPLDSVAPDGRPRGPDIATTRNAEDPRRQAEVVLGEQDIALLRPFGEIRATAPGDVLFDVGDPSYALVVVLSGRVDLVDRSRGDEALIRTFGSGEFVGELGLLTGQTVFAACVVREAGEVLLVPRSGVQEVIATLPAVGDLLVTAFAANRQRLMRSAASTLTLIGAETSPGIERLQQFATRNRIPYRQLDPAAPEAVALLARFAPGERADAWVVVRGQTMLADPTTFAVARAIGLDLPAEQDAPVDLLVIGAGPAGLSAAVYGASEGLSTTIVEKFGIGGQAGSSTRIENYLGFPSGISGGDLAFRAEVQAIKFGARVTVPRQAMSLARGNGLFAVRLDDGTILRGRSVVIATGVRYRDLGVPDEATFAGRGVHYAATELEARLCRNREVVVVGAGNSAGQAAMFLAGTARTVHLVCRGPDLGRTMSQYLITRLEHTANVRIRTGCVVTAFRGRESVESVTIANAQGGTEEIPGRAVFVMIGADPHTDWLRGTVELDQRGFVLTGTALAAGGAPAVASPFQTSEPGIFAVGDVRSGSVKRVASAVGEGAVVVLAVHGYLAATRGTDGQGVDARRRERPSAA